MCIHSTCTHVLIHMHNLLTQMIKQNLQICRYGSRGQGGSFGDQINNQEIRGWERGGSLGPFGSSQILTAPSSPYLHMVGSQDNPATEAIAQVDDSHTAAETHDTGQCHTQCGNQDLQRGNGTTVKATVTTQLALKWQGGPHQCDQRSC